MAFCFAHPAVEATATCAACDQPLCTRCTKGTLDGLMCPACAGRRYGRRRLITALEVGAVAALLIGTAVFGLIVVGKGSERAKPAPVDPHAEQDPLVADLRATRDLAPCDLANVRKLLSVLAKARRYADVVEDGTAYVAKCGSHPGIARDLVYPLQQLGRFAEAARQSTILIGNSPYDSDYWWWRAEDLARAGEPERALADYRQSFANSDGVRQSRFAARRILEVAGPADRPCEGVAALDYFVTVHGGELADDLDQQVRGLDLSSSCDRRRGRGRAALPPPSDHVETTVTVSGVAGRFLIEDRCGTTTVARGFAERAGIAARAGPRIDTIAVGAVRTGPQATADLVVGGATAPATELVVVDGLPEGIDGVIGLSLMWKFAREFRDDDQGLDLVGADQ